MTTHAVAVAQSGGRYPHVPVCSCGWSTRGYVAGHAAWLMADDHAREAADAELAAT